MVGPEGFEPNKGRALFLVVAILLWVILRFNFFAYYYIDTNGWYVVGSHRISNQAEGRSHPGGISVSK